MEEIIKYSITTATQTIEFASLAEAQAYKAANSLNEEIVEVRESVVETIEIPEVSPRQIRQALILSGVSLSQIDQALESLPEPQRSLAIAEWEYSNTFDRQRALVQNVAALLGWTNEQLDNLWLFAGTL